MGNSEVKNSVEKVKDFWYCQRCNEAIEHGIYTGLFNRDLCPHCFTLLDLIKPYYSGEMYDALDM